MLMQENYRPLSTSIAYGYGTQLDMVCIPLYMVTTSIVYRYKPLHKVLGVGNELLTVVKLMTISINAL
jgi:hypothetical protein